MEQITFIVHHKGGRREQVTTHYRHAYEHEVDAAWDYINMCYPDVDYIEIL